MTYPGGKNGPGVYQTIINLIPPHNIYIEPFLGSGAILRMKRPAPVGNFGIDIDLQAVRMFTKTCPLDNVKIIHGDCIELLSSETNISREPDTFLYFDPPYLMDTRSTKRPLYKCEFSTEEEHSRLLDFIISLRSMVMISGYDSNLYNDRLRGWNKVTYQAMTRGGHMATECLWMNYPEPLELHQYNFLGSDYRERERIKRKQNRWKSRLSRLDRLERLAIMAALDDLRSSSHRQG